MGILEMSFNYFISVQLLILVKKDSKMNETYGLQSLLAVDKDIIFGSFKPASMATSNHFWNCNLKNVSNKLTPYLKIN